MMKSRETFDMVLNAQNTGRLEEIENMLDLVRQAAGRLMPMVIPKTAMGCSGMGQIQRAIHKLMEAKVEFSLIKERIEEGINNG